ncbi:uncharacterized protein LY79DRAFT_567924 [Colletotrichum navitas]|uniref:Uncharacterized protein n=1 Tax=Colletotrichum navitas TaxID=681940 RepID=A0AAD8V0Z3_9PEZI|nr:uncharacterized protein LY79DRAFT_567924 [Colletotrichum navitas]KAK1573779.1 hypothetical protein LY79DRAFT_567924 [Colletotrichum navitas]
MSLPHVPRPTISVRSSQGKAPSGRSPPSSEVAARSGRPRGEEVNRRPSPCLVRMIRCPFNPQTGDRRSGCYRLSSFLCFRSPPSPLARK